MYVKWGSTMSSKFQVTNGVRQGGVLSLLLFDVYVNELSELLNKSGIGGNLGGTLINHMLYADDICIVSLSSSGLQHLLNPIRSGLFHTVNDPGGGGGAFKAPPYDLENYCVNLHHIMHVNFTRCFWHDPIGIFKNSRF